jgi:hypothetical protein
MIILVGNFFLVDGFRLNKGFLYNQFDDDIDQQDAGVIFIGRFILNDAFASLVGIFYPLHTPQCSLPANINNAQKSSNRGIDCVNRFCAGIVEAWKELKT